MAMTVVGGELEKAGYGHLYCQPAPANDLLTIIEKGAEVC